MKIPDSFLASYRLTSAIKRPACILVAGSWLFTGMTVEAAPANDDFAAPITLSQNAGVQSGTDTVGATPQVGEPAMGPAGEPPYNNTVWFKWTALASGTFTVSTLGSKAPDATEWDAALGIYSGAALNELILLGTTPVDVALEETRSVPVIAGQTYYIQLAGWQAAVASNIKLTWSFVNAATFLTFGPGAVLGELTANEASINLTVPYNSDLATIAPTFTLSPGSTCNRVSGAVPTPNFSAGSVVYTVTSAGPSPTINNYTVTAEFVKSLLWNVANGEYWNFESQNWLKQPTGPETAFTDGDAVVFDKDTGGLIYISSPVSPFAVSVSAAAGTFTIDAMGIGIEGIGSLTKSNAGSLVLRGINSYTGDTVVNGGNLVVGSALAISGSKNFRVASGATLSLTGTLPASSWPTQTATLSGAGTVNIDFNGMDGISSKFDMSALTGTVNLSGGRINLVSAQTTGFVCPLSGTINIENQTTLYLGWLPSDTFTANIKLSGGTDFGDGLGVLRSDKATLNGTLTLQTNTTIGCYGVPSPTDPGGLFNLNSVIGDGGNGYGFTVVGNGTVVITAANTYSGTTAVNVGTNLKVNAPGALGSGPLSINGKLNLNYVGTKTVASLTTGGVAQTATGTYGATTSGALFKDDVHFTPGSTGTVTVGSKFDSWISGYTFAVGSDITPSGDADGDGVTNFQEYAFGLDPSLSASLSPITQQLNRVTGNFQYIRRATPATTGLIYTVLTSTDLVTWTPGSTTETGSTTLDSVETVSVRVDAPAVAGKLFVKVQAAPAP